MQVTVRTFAAGALLALLVPAAALAQEVRVSGPVVLQGQGFFGGELELELGEGQRPVRVAGRQGYVGFLDLGGDLKVRCLGQGRAAKHETKQGTVHLCKGRGGQAVVLGSHFKLRGFAHVYRIQLPAGASGTLKGRFVRCAAAKRCGAAAGERNPRRDGPDERDERDERREQDAPIPTVAEVAAELAAATSG